MRIVVPYAERRPKTRLAPALDGDERAAFARRMLADVLAAVRAAGGEPTVLTPDPIDVDAGTIVDERALTPAVNAAIDSAAEPTAVVMADLALADPGSLSRLVAAEGDVVIAPGRGGGTNALVVRDPTFRADYHGASYLDHLAVSRDRDLSVAEIDSRRLATDVDEPADLVEVLVHGGSEGGARSREWLAAAGFSLAERDGRVGIERDGEPVV